MVKIIFISLCLISFKGFAGPDLPQMSDQCLNLGFSSIDSYQDLAKKYSEEALLAYIKAPLYTRYEWHRMSQPHLQVRTYGFYESIYASFYKYKRGNELSNEKDEWIDNALEFYSPQGLELVLKSRAPHARELSPEKLKARMLSPRTYDESGLGTLFGKYPQLSWTACAGIDLIHLSKCNEALKYTYHNLYDTGDDLFNLGNGWLAEIATSNDAAAGGFRLVHKMISRIKNNDFLSASLMEDVYESFADPKMAEDFLLLGLVHGQYSWMSFDMRGLIFSYNHATMIAAYMMSVTSAYLDSLVAYGTGFNRTYILPRGMKNICDNGKSYHYIVPWYIARRLTDLGYNNRIASQIPYFFEWGYQSFSKSLGRDPFRNVNQSHNSLENQRHRLDLLFAMNASLYGAGSFSENNSQPDMMKAFLDSEAAVKPDYQNAFAITPSNEVSTYVKIADISNQRFNFDDFFRFLHHH